MLECKFLREGYKIFQSFYFSWTNCPFNNWANKFKSLTVLQDDMGLDLDEDGEDYNEEDSGVESGFGRFVLYIQQG